MTPKYKKTKDETKIEFVTRIVTSENKPMTASDVIACIDKRSMKKVNAKNIHANLSDAVSKYDSLCKKRMKNEQGQTRVHYYPCNMEVEGEEIPVPSYTKEGGNTFTKEGVDLDDLPADGPQVPPAVKVAEKILADAPAKREPIKRRFVIDGGWVEVVDDMPKTFTPNALRSIADGVNMSDDYLVRMLVATLRSRTATFNQQTQSLVYHIKQFMLDNYGLSGHQRK